MVLYLFLHQLQVLFATFPKKAFENKRKIRISLFIIYCVYQNVLNLL